MFFYGYLGRVPLIMGFIRLWGYDGSILEALTDRKPPLTLDKWLQQADLCGEAHELMANENGVLICSVKLRF